MRDQWVNWLEPVRALAAEASVRILDIYATAFDVAAKADDSPLTAADLASHHAIVAGLQRLTPDIPISVSYTHLDVYKRQVLLDGFDRIAGRDPGRG